MASRSRNVPDRPNVYNVDGYTRRTRIENQRRALGWKGSYALASVGAGAGCMECGGHIVTETTGQLALFRHGGYGATLSVTRRWCPSCGWDAGTHRTETNPRR